MKIKTAGSSPAVGHYAFKSSGLIGRSGVGLQSSLPKSDMIYK
jgi:hypothetical protein